MHFIAKQITELSIRHANEAFKIQNDFANAFRREAVPMLEKLFDRLFDNDEVVQIERLEIDLGNLSSKDLSAGHFVALLEQKLEEVLTVHIHQTEQLSRRIPIPKNHFEQWLYFLEYGSFSWEMPQPKHQKWLRDVLDTLGTDAKAIAQLTDLLRKNNTAFKRLILQYEPVFLKTIVELFTGQKQDELIVFLKEWQAIQKAIYKNKKIKTTTNSIRQEEQTFWTILLEKVILQREKKTWKALCADYVLAQTEGELMVEMTRIIQQKKKTYPLVIELLKEKNISQYISKNQSDDLVKDSKKENQQPIKNEGQNKNKPTEKPDITKPENNKPTKKTGDKKTDKKSEQPIKEEKNNAAPNSPNTSIFQHINTSTQQHISTPTSQHPNTPIPQHPNTPTPQYPNTPIPQLVHPQCWHSHVASFSRTFI